MNIDINADDVREVALSRGIQLTDLQVDQVLESYREREWIKVKWHISDIITELDLHQLP